jgi:OOP family OmpA-OmpF porin
MEIAPLFALALATTAPQPPTDVPPPCSPLFMVMFEPASAALSPQSRAILDIAGQPYRQWDLDSRLSIHAWTDRVGSRASNLRLALRRGEAVRDYLVGLGIAKRRIGILAHGEAAPTADTPDETPNPLNRAARVVEEITRDEMARRKAAWAAFPNIVC